MSPYRFALFLAPACAGLLAGPRKACTKTTAERRSARGWLSIFSSTTRVMRQTNLAMGVFIIISSFSAGYAQTPVPAFQYTYDNAGNRIKRALIYIIPKAGDFEGEDGKAVVSSMDDIQFKLFPNPTDRYLNIEIKTEGDYELTQTDLELHSTTGQTILLKKGVVFPYRLDMGNLSNGHFILRISVNNDSREWSLIKQ